MKLLFVAARWDPRNPDSGSGVNYNGFNELTNRVEDIKIVGPFQSDLTLFEKGVRRIAGLFQKKRLIKFYPSYVRKSNAAVQEAVEEFRPDVIFSKSSIPLVNVKLSAPLVYMCDSTVKWTTDNWPLFSSFGMKMMENWERKVIEKASHIITFSQANADVLEDYYNIPASRITVHPIPSSLPHREDDFQPNPISTNEPLKLLLVGKEYHRKGVDIAVETVQQLNAAGIPAELRIVGQDNQDSDHVTFMGLYEKRNPKQLSAYMDNYRWAHFLLFPSRFDAAGIVPSEAAGFGVPTITNAAGGIATTVEDGVSGVVLPKHSPSEQYVRTIEYYWNNPIEYNKLRESTYARFSSNLNWNILGDKLFSIIQQTVHQQSS
ncbi:glycosyltransferase family 4 protein [bacterium]|nr:glycosyltransferase family 4 protein [bacterium]